MLRQNLTIIALAIVSSVPLLASAQTVTRPFQDQPRSLEVQIPRGRFVGMPVRWTPHQAILLEPSGRFQTFGPKELLSHRLLDESFLPQSLPQARGRLASELGADFETIISGPYVIAAPKGEADRWQERFRRLLAGYVRYFEVRGWAIRKPDFPLCVVVLPDRESFRRYASTEVATVPEKAVGSYFPMSNRCMLYQIPGGGGTNWSQTEATVVHEAIHQLAYNTGVHERLFNNPLWFVEGLATMFESPAVYDSQASRSTIVDRMNPDMKSELKPSFADGSSLEQDVQRLIVSDELFQSDPIKAYAVAWGMTFTLAERMPREYGKFMQLQQSRGFGDYSPGDRLADFRAAFDISPSTLTYQMQRLLNN